MSRYRLEPTVEQQDVLLRYCAQARFVWNLAVEQHSHWRPGRKSGPGYLEQCRQLTAARAEHSWLAEGSQTVQQAPGRVQRVNPAFTSQRCSACGHTARESRKSQALFRCVACGYTGNADVNAARNIAAGHVVKARGGDRAAGPANREPQLLLQIA